MLEERIVNLQKRVNVLEIERNTVLKRKENAQKRVIVAREKQKDLDIVQSTLQYVAARVQTKFGGHVGALVTKAVHHVFPERRRDVFIVRFRENRGKTECQLRLRTTEGEESHPYHCSGGGVWDVISFALRCACLVLEQPQHTRFLVLDEPFKFLHGVEVRKRALSMLYNTCKTLGIQAVVVHQGDDSEDDSHEIFEEKADCLIHQVILTTYETSKII